jgi:hypothetical protein
MNKCANVKAENPDIDVVFDKYVIKKNLNIISTNSAASGRDWSQF